MSENPSMCADRKAAPEILGKVMVLGLGTTGRAVCDYLLTQQERLEVFSMQVLLLRMRARSQQRSKQLVLRSSSTR